MRIPASPCAAKLSTVSARSNRQPLSYEALVASALRLIDEQGYDAFSMRALGESMGVHATAIYRYFGSKDELIEAVLGYMLEREGVGIPERGTPRERLLYLVRELRRAFRAHPHLALPNLTMQDEQATSDLVNAVLNLLGEMGLRGDTLIRAYQMLETFTVGSNAYDWGNYPESLEARRRGRRLSGHPAFEEPSRSIEAMQELNDQTFEMTANILLDACEQMGDAQQ